MSGPRGQSLTNAKRPYDAETPAQQGLYGGAGDRDRTGMASLEGPSGPSTFVRQGTSSQVSGVVASRNVRGDPSRPVCFGHAKGT